MVSDEDELRSWEDEDEDDDDDDELGEQEDDSLAGTKEENN